MGAGKSGRVNQISFIVRMQEAQKYFQQIGRFAQNFCYKHALKLFIGKPIKGGS